MKSSLKVLSSLFLIYMFMTSCDKVEGPFSEPVNQGGVDTSVVDTSSTDTISGTIHDTVRNVLLEDYTGHKCQGCPAAHDEATTIQNAVGNRLAIIALHVGYWATTNATGNFTYNFENQTGLDLYGALVPSSQPFPTGTINRKMYGSNRVVIYSDWGNKVQQLLQEPADASMKVTTSYNSITRVISASVKTTFLDNLTGDVSLAVYYTEDSIINWQAFPSPTGNVPDYVHRRVLRGALTSTWGSIIATNPVYGFSVSGTVTGTPIAADINIDHVHVIAVLSDNATKEVIQVEEVQLNN